MGGERIVALASEKETLAWGKTLGQGFSPNTLLLLRGDLGAGKTTLTRGIAKGLAILGEIQSPTFVYQMVYEGGTLPLWHFDLYRVGNREEFFRMGWDECWTLGGVCVVEWPEILEPLPRLDGVTVVEITLEYRDKSRIAKMRGG